MKQQARTWPIPALLSGLILLTLHGAQAQESAASLCGRIGEDVMRMFEQSGDPVFASAGPAPGTFQCRWKLTDFDIGFETSVMPSIVAARGVVTDSLTGDDHIPPRATGLTGIGDAAAMRDALDTPKPALDLLAVRGARRFVLSVHPSGRGIARHRIIVPAMSVLGRQVASLFKH